jgi:hypothetical protein
LNTKYNTPNSIGGHLKYCPERPRTEERTKLSVDEIDEILHSEEDLDLTDDNFLACFEELSGDFIQKQRDLLSTEDIESLKAGRVKLLNGDYANADMRVYLHIGQFVSTCDGLDEERATLLLLLIKRVSYINGEEIPLPAKYATIRENILKNLDGHKATLNRVEFSLDPALFGSRELDKCVSVMSPLLDMLQRMLLDDELVGEHCENIHLTSRQIYNADGKRVFSDWTSGYFYEDYEAAVKERYGDDTTLFIFIVSADKTGLNKSGSLSAYPAYLGIGTCP